jgi:peptide/nickel transport system permease protein
MIATARARAIGADLFRSHLSRLGGLLVLLVLIAAAFAPWIAPFDPYSQPSRRFVPPGALHWAGTDELGRDVFSRAVFGARISLYVATFSVLLGGLVGASLGSLAGYFRGALDQAVMRVTDVMLAFPGIVLAIFLSAVLGPNLRNATIAIGIVYIPIFARVARGQVLSVAEADYVQAAHAAGTPDLRILLRHVLPNAAAPLIVQATISFANAIVAEAALSFLGLGAQPPEPSWGTMLSSGRGYMEVAPWVVVVPGLAISLTVLGLNLFGDALRDALDPRLRPVR